MHAAVYTLFAGAAVWVLVFGVLMARAYRASAVTQRRKTDRGAAASALGTDHPQLIDSR
ncbi:hypothetical protein AB7813_08305 [Tardiphaga sp. 20_F10_N6_6]|uniref:hypothetical protein n=1 Tax=Tardiphaga sp. 20_F10_N6_6 TaxID=3240788 RepID=UPI003F88A31B